MISVFWKLVLPLTLVSFFIITKWWFVAVVDAPNSWMYGFPFPYLCDGWHTSFSYQFFLKEFVIDFLIYLVFWGVVARLAKSSLKRMKVPRIGIYIFWSLIGIILLAVVRIATLPGHVYSLERHIEIEILETGFKFPWQILERPDLNEPLSIHIPLKE